MTETMKWDRRFLDLAKLVSSWSKDPSSKVGAVIVDADRRILGVGYNGFPRGTNDDHMIYSDRPRKYLRVVHAEANAILNSNGNLEGATIYCTHPPCASCTGLIIQSGIRTVISLQANEQFYIRLRDSLDEAELMLNESGIQRWTYD